MTDDTRLRHLLEDAVPDDAPPFDAPDLAGRARTARTRRRRTAGAVAGVLAVGATIAGVGLLGDRDPDRDPERGNDVAAVPAGTTAPYDAPGCPATLRELIDAASDLGDLTGIASVRLCPDTGLSALGTGVDPGTTSGAPAPDTGLPEALVSDLSGFVDRVAELPDFDPAACATISVLNTRQSLQVTYADGTTTLVPTAMCSPMTAAGRAVDGGGLATAFLGALDAQRDDLDYTRPFTGELTCDHVSLPSPARPGREELVQAVACDQDNTTTRLDADQLADLQAAWEDSTGIDPADPEQENPCTEFDEAPRQVVVATDHGDVLRLFESPCGYLVWDGWQPGESEAVPTTVEALGLRP